jgi:uncharacterized membrane protein SpoIIM required for sporulation
MEIGRAISFIFQDPRWITKVLICGVLFLVPIIGWLLIGGYMLRLVHNVMIGDSQPLPEWNNWGGDLAGGLKAFVVYFIWGIPLWIVQGIDRSVDSALLALIAAVISFLWGAVNMSAISDLARDGNIADALNLRPLNRVINNLGVYLLYAIATFVFGLLALVGLIGLVIGVIFTLAIAIMAGSHLGGQAYRQAEGMGAVPAPRF